MCSTYYLIIFNLWYIIIATCIASGPLNDYVMQVPPQPLGYYSRDRLHITANVFSFFFLNYYGKTSINELGANSNYYVRTTLNLSLGHCYKSVTTSSCTTTGQVSYACSCGPSRPSHVITLVDFTSSSPRPADGL